MRSISFVFVFVAFMLGYSVVYFSTSLNQQVQIDLASQDDAKPDPTPVYPAVINWIRSKDPKFYEKPLVETRKTINKALCEFMEYHAGEENWGTVQCFESLGKLRRCTNDSKSIADCIDLKNYLETNECYWRGLGAAGCVWTPLSHMSLRSFPLNLDDLIALREGVWNNEVLLEQWKQFKVKSGGKEDPRSDYFDVERILLSEELKNEIWEKRLVPTMKKALNATARVQASEKCKPETAAKLEEQGATYLDHLEIINQQEIRGGAKEHIMKSIQCMKEFACSFGAEYKRFSYLKCPKIDDLLATQEAETCVFKRKK